MVKDIISNELKLRVKPSIIVFICSYIPIVILVVLLENIFYSRNMFGIFNIATVLLTFVITSLSPICLLRFCIIKLILKYNNISIFNKVIYFFNGITFYLLLNASLHSYESLTDMRLTQVWILIGTSLVLPMMYCISMSKRKSNMKFMMCIIITFLYLIFVIEELGAIPFVTILIMLWINTIYDIITRKNNFTDTNGYVLNNLTIFKRNIVKFICLSCLPIVVVHYINTKEILWDKITDTQYSSPLERKIV